MRARWDSSKQPPRRRYTRLPVLVLRELIRRTERKQARAIDALRRASRLETGATEVAISKWWLDLLDERHGELRIALNIRTGRPSEILRFPGGKRCAYPR